MGGPFLTYGYVSSLSYWKNISMEAIEKFVNPMFSKIAQKCFQMFYVNYVKFGNFFEYFFISDGHYLLTSPLLGGGLPFLTYGLFLFWVLIIEEMCLRKPFKNLQVH